MSSRGRREAGSRVAHRLPVLLDAHRAALSGCRRCTFGDPAVAPVVSEASDPVAMLVGQAPGKTELVDRRPFTGRAGRTLFRWLADAGIAEEVARRRVYIAAVTRCYPGPSPSGRGDRVPSPAEISACGGWLDTELELLSPRVLVPVGRLAIARFLDARPLDELVGAAHVVRHAGGESLAIPLPHPSGASSWIHQPGHLELVRRALALLRRHLPELVRESDASRRVA